MMVLVAVSIPLLAYLGLDTIAKSLFFASHLICSQIRFPRPRFILFGHQLGLDVHCLAISSALCASPSSRSYHERAAA